MSKIELMQGDCLEQMKKIESGSVDMILADPPYGTTACKWDSVIPLEPMWEQLQRVIKPNGAIVMTASQPFTTTLISSNIKMFKYCMVWDKGRTMEPQLANIRPMKCHEDLVVFCHGKTTYNPQKTKLDAPDRRKASGRKNNRLDGTGHNILSSVNSEDRTYTDRFPLSICRFGNSNQKDKQHPTQKPVALMEYLIRTYTNEGETVLDFVMGSGTTGVACVNLGRNFIGIELDDTYFKIARNRINEALESPFLGYFASGNDS
jgi:site-specific DNA-methyltransferase (adenine-specific)